MSVAIKDKYICYVKCAFMKAVPVNRGLCLPYKNYLMHRLPIYKYITYTCPEYTYKISEKYT